MADEWKKLHRELKILRAKQNAGGWLHPKDAERLAFLEERLGDAAEVERIQVDEPVDSGPKTVTSDDHYATEVSEQLLQNAQEYEPQKYYEKELVEHPKTEFEARDTREGQQTFKQEGLSNFAIEATEDMREGEIGLAEAPQEEEVGATKIDHHRAVYATDESERLTKKPSGKAANPFALEISDELADSLERHQDDDSAVPDTTSAAHEVEYQEEDEIPQVASVQLVHGEEPTKNVGVPVDLEGELTQMSYPESAVPDLGEETDEPVIRKSYDLPVDKIDHGEVKEEKKIHGIDSTVHGGLDYDLMRQALEAASEEDLLAESEFEEVPDVSEEEPRGKVEQGETTAVAPDPTYQEDTAAFDRPDFSHIPEPEPEPSDNLAVLVPDPPPMTDLSEPKQPDGIYSDDEPTGPEVAHPGPASAAEQTGDDLPVPPPPPPPPPEEAQVAAPSAESVDLDDGDDLLAEAEALIRAAEEAEQSVQSEPSGEAEVELVVDLEEGQADAQAQTSQDELGADIDEFWGTSTSESTKEGPALQLADTAEPLSAADSDEMFDLDLPAEQEKPTKEQEAPLPALGVPKAPPPKEKPAASNEKDFINALFSDSEIEQSSEEDGLVPAPAPASTMTPGPTGGTVPGLTPSRPTTKPGLGKAGAGQNDLRGPRKATVHYKDGVTRRGVLGQVDTDADTIRLDPPSGSSAPSENLVALSLKTIFLMLPRGNPHPQPEGPAVRMLLIDGRALEGNTPDYDPQRKAFTLFPKASRGNIERIIVFNDAVKNIWFEEA